MALLGGPGEVALSGDRDKVLQLTEEHPHLLGTRAPVSLRLPLLDRHDGQPGYRDDVCYDG
ncbi:hypothetical protein MLAC_41170 [Mycobacterium lacus]|uniref:Uncharacterized protein n=1 Tax=Mycobacterium lacus TaxID=169765 RepID=A0A7I7NRB8_9MYCO|nr:hypothetical protein MLAC_41170 [Mycobacterium lacus]